MYHKDVLLYLGSKQWVPEEDEEEGEVLVALLRTTAFELKEMLLRQLICKLGMNVREDVVIEEVVRVQPPVNFTSLSKDFAGLGERSFNGKKKIIGVQTYLYTCERIFVDRKMDDRIRSRLASCQLMSAAMDW